MFAVSRTIRLAEEFLWFLASVFVHFGVFAQFCPSSFLLF